jgi:hypothetical protein
MAHVTKTIGTLSQSPHSAAPMLLNPMISRRGAAEMVPSAEEPETSAGAPDRRRHDN